ncbi:OmpA family protein [Fulvivirga lutea]|uniref:OmpA family protein n=1 Tax=Fulvivirga lutea TaxID=2810512 RepID=A0A974WG90_9BACT|nr:OmpA family protein [Fulvivirga lutea]QSE97294.1 OmpA family protein [Fulvivirga lutea]
MWKIHLIICCLFFCAYQSIAQSRLSTKSKKAAELYYEADNYRVRGQYNQAISLLEQSIQKDKKFHEAYFRLATIYKAQGDLTKAESLFLNVIELKGENNGPSYFELGELYLRKNDYKQAIDYINKYLAYNPRNSQRVMEANTILSNAQFAIENNKREVSFNPKPLSDTVNAFAMQYFPVVTVDGQSLIFTRRLGDTPNDDEDLVICKLDSNGQWSAPESISSNINSQFNEGTCTISADGRVLIFTSCYGRNGYGSCDLYISEKEGGVWSVPENLGPNINSRYWESQPSLSADGRTLYFISNRPNGLGGRDIWVSYKDDSEVWSKPKNMGPLVNTVQEEVSPFIHPNGLILYYATNGLPGFGGFDLYSSQRDNDSWSKPVNIGSPINNGEDQVSLFITSRGDKGYYSNESLNSEKKGVLYEFELSEIYELENKASYVQGIVRDAETKSPLKAKIELFDLSQDERLSVVYSDSVTGEYLMVLTEGSEYALYANAKSYLFNTYTFKMELNNDSEPVAMDIYLSPIKENVSTRLNNIFFDTDSYSLKDNSKTELKKIISFLKDNPKVRIEIVGHTDNDGNDSYNQELSLKRAESVVEYLKNAGIDQSRLYFKGKGASNPLVPNTTEENKSLNRRIEFKIVEF